jgi:CBS domain-containing membrane protein
MIGWLRGFLPVQTKTSASERLRASCGACVGIILAAILSALVAGQAGATPLLIAPMGASAVLLFALPASPLAQPWSILAGNLLSAFVGVTAALLIPSPLIAAAVATGVATGLMAVLRCTHPPSGAVALTAVLGGPSVLAAGYHFLLVPVLLNSILLTLSALVYNNLTGVSYPHKAHAPAHPHLPARPLVVTEADFDAVLTDYGEALDIDREDLRRIYEELVGRAEERRKETAS